MKEEVEAWKKQDPFCDSRSISPRRKILTEDLKKQVAAEINTEIDEAVDVRRGIVRSRISPKTRLCTSGPEGDLGTMARTITYIEAITEALDQELGRDERVFILGEDIGLSGGVFKATAGLLDKYGEDRVLDTPLAEGIIIASAIGAP